MAKNAFFCVNHCHKMLQILWQIWPQKYFFYVHLYCKKTLQNIPNLQHNFWTWVWPHSPVWTMFQKTTQGEQKWPRVNSREMESEEAPHVSHDVRGISWLVKIIFYFISFLVVCLKYKIYTIKGVLKILLLGSRISTQSLLVETMIKGKTWRIAVFFLHMPFDSKNASDAKIKFHFRSSVAEIFFFCCFLGVIFVPLSWRRLP